MNMMFRDEQMLAGIAPKAKPRFHPAAAGAVLFGHLVLAALLLLGRTVQPAAPPPQPISIDILPAAAKTPALPPAPKLVAPSLPQMAPPGITLEAAPSRAIATAAAPSAAAPTASGTAPETYFSRLVAWLDARKRYPPEARRAHIEGVVQLHFVLDRSGRVLRYEIAASSGRPILDAEAQALIERAQPLPPLPADWPQTQLDLVVPVVFRLR